MDEVVGEALQVKQRMQREIHAVEQDQELSADGKTTRVAELRQSADAEVQALRQRDEEARVKRVSELRKEAFAPDLPWGAAESDSESLAIKSEYSRALDRAESISNGREMARLMRRSIDVGDTMLTRALARVAYDRSYRGALDVFVEAFPAKLQTLKALDAHTLGPRKATERAREKLRRNMAFGRVNNG